MPPLPKRKISYTRKRTRQAHKATGLAKPNLCPNCGNPKMSHRACLTCGMYAGRQVLEPRSAAE